MWVCVCVCMRGQRNFRPKRPTATKIRKINLQICTYVCIYTHAHLQCIHTHMRIFGKFANLRFVAKASKFCVTQNVQLIEIVSLYLLICSYLGMFGFLLLPQRLADIHIYMFYGYIRLCLCKQEAAVAGKYYVLLNCLINFRDYNYFNIKNSPRLTSRYFYIFICCVNILITIIYEGKY